MSTEQAKPMFNSKERGLLEALEKRLDYLTAPSTTRHAPEGGYDESNGFFAGEASALAWAIAIVTGSLEPVDIRVERHERRLRKIEADIGRIKKTLADFEEEDE